MVGGLNLNELISSPSYLLHSRVELPNHVIQLFRNGVGSLGGRAQLVSDVGGNFSTSVATGCPCLKVGHT